MFGVAKTSSYSLEKVGIIDKTVIRVTSMTRMLYRLQTTLFDQMSVDFQQI